MNDNKKRLKQRVINACEEALYKNQYVSAIDVFAGMNLLQLTQIEDWRKGKISCLEKVIQGNLSKITFCMQCFRSWAHEKGLKPSFSEYVRRKVSGPARILRFSVSGKPQIEESYRTHYISPLLSEIKQKKIQEKIDNPPPLAVFQTVHHSQCSQCEIEVNTGSFLYNDNGQYVCLNCTQLNELEYLPGRISGTFKIIRKCEKEGIQFTRVVQFKRSDKRYTRIGILIEKEPLYKVRKELKIEIDDEPIYLKEKNDFLEYRRKFQCQKK